MAAKDGGLIAVRLHLRSLPLPGPAEALEDIVEDVTEVRSLEHQLQQAQKFETIGQLAGGIAHDFNSVVGAPGLGRDRLRTVPHLSADCRTLLSHSRPG